MRLNTAYALVSQPQQQHGKRPAQSQQAAKSDDDEDVKPAKTPKVCTDPAQ